MNRKYFVAFALYLLIACIVTYPLITHLTREMVGFVHSDAYEMAHHIWWFTHAARTGEPLFYQTMLGYPDGIDGIILSAVPLQFFPAWLFAFVIGVPASYNVTILLTMTLNGLAMFALVRYLLGAKRTDANHGVPTADWDRPYAPFLAGVIFMLYPTMQGHLAAGHAGLFVQWTLVLYALALLRLIELPSTRAVLIRRIGIVALLFVASGWGHTLQVLYASAPLTGVILLWILLRREWDAFRRMLTASVIGGVLFVLFIFPVIGVSLGTSAITDEGGFVRYSADLLAPVTPSFLHPVYGALDYTRRVLGVNLDEGAAYIGIAGGILALIGVIRQHRARIWLALALTAFILSLGPLLKLFDQPITFTTDGYTSAVTMPFAYIANLPGISLARTPGRFSFVLALTVAVMAGYGASTLFSSSSRLRKVRGLLALILTAFIIFDYQTFFPVPTTTAVAPEAITALSERSDVRAVFDVPYDNLITAKNSLFLQTAHKLPMIAGQLTRNTPVNPAKLRILQATLDPTLLRDAGADVVIVHRAEDTDGSLFARATDQLGNPIYDDDTYAIFETPPTDAAPEFITLYTLPDSLTSEMIISVYAPQPTGALLTVGLAAEGQDVITRLDQQAEPLARWTINGAAEATVFIGFDAGYHTVTLSLDPPCVTPTSAALICRSVEIDHLTLERAQ